MAHGKILTLLVAISVALSFAHGEVELITKPEPGQEYVFLQTTATGSRPVERKEKPSANERIFETAHKLPPSLTFALNQAEAEDDEIATAPKPKAVPKTVNKASKPKREALAADAPLPAPAGAIKLDVQTLLARYKTELKASTTTTTAKPTAGNGAGSRNTRKPRVNSVPGNKRTKKAAVDESVIATTPSSVLTTSSAGLKPIEKDDDVPLLASGSEKQRSRIQIKKGPNGQEYEYEYVYYYYDEEDDPDKNSSKQSSARDGPARNEIAPQSTPSRSGPSRGDAKGATSEPGSNEVLPTSRGRSRGRQLEDEDVADERLPANTRFPPRSRNLNTTPTSLEETGEEVKPRGRGRGRPEGLGAATSAESNSDSVSDETQGSRGRTRANVRRPSLELVDSASFNTHTSSGEPPNGSGPTFPADLPAGPVRFLGATPNERMDLHDKKESSAETLAASLTDETTTMMSAMDKVALDLYAILQGTQRLAGEEPEGNTEVNTESDAETTTLEVTTEVLTTEAPTTTTTSTTTTTTTTQAPPSAAPENIFGRGKYRSRPVIGGRKPVSTTTTTEAPAGASDGKPKSRFSRPSFGSRPKSRPAAAPAESDTEQKETKEEAKLVNATRTRSRFGAARTRATTAATVEGTAESKAPATSKPSLRPRPTFNLRGRTRPTPAPEGGESAPTEEGQEASTTVRSRLKLNASNVRPLRPGPRLNLAGGRGRLGASTAAPADTPAEPAPVAEEDQEKGHADDGETKEAEVTPAPNTNPLSRLRNRQRTPLQVRPAAPKAAASAPVQVRRANPLISRRKPIGDASTTEATSLADVAHATDALAEAEEGATDAAPSSTTSTTEEPKGLNKLLAGRRRLALRQPGTAA